MIVAVNAIVASFKRSVVGGGGTIGPISIAADGDDGEIFGATTFWSNGENGDGLCWIGSYAASTQWGFFRFILPSSIPAGATITNATLTLYGRDQFNWNHGVSDLNIRATDSADASAPTTAGQAPIAIVGGSTATTTAVAVWSNVTWNTNGVNTSVSIAAVIQELVNDYGGLASNAGIVLWVNGTDNDGGRYAACELNERAGSSEVATLTIQWT